MTLNIGRLEVSGNNLKPGKNMTERQQNGTPPENDRSSFSLVLNILRVSFYKSTLVQVYFCDFCGIFKMTFSQNTSAQQILKYILISAQKIKLGQISTF